ncbi:M14 family metallopeptidase [soil metagenome]
MTARFGSVGTLALSLLAGVVPVASQVVPSPEQVLGHRVGADGRLAEWSGIEDYFQRLAAASPYVSLERIGTTVLGRPMIMAVITAPENQARLGVIRANQARLADPRGATNDQLEQLYREQPAIAFIGASLHGNEIMATQMSMELAYDLATESSLQSALRNVVVLLVPGMNPDGLDITRDWWMRTRNTPQEGAAMPWLYHHYVGHDNNRDFFMITQPETRAATRVLYEEWFPQVVFDVHQMGNRGARFFIPPFADPLNPNIDPLIVRMTNLVGVQMALDLTAAGKTGVSHQERFDLWWHGGGRTVPARHNMVGILSEAASANYGDPIEQTAADLDEPELGSMYPEPWQPGRWSPRDIVEYELIAARSLVGLMDRQREQFARNLVSLARRQIQAGEAGGPVAYIVPSNQRDPGSAAELLRVLRRGGVEIHETAQILNVDGRSYPAGSRVVLMAQPFRAHAKDLLERQQYPERRLFPGGPPAPPYDLAGWTLPLQMGVEVVEVRAPFSTTSLVQLDSITTHRGSVAGTSASRTRAVVLDPRMNASHRAVFEVLRAGGRVNFTTEPTVANGLSLPVGSPVVWGPVDLASRAERWANEWGVQALVTQPPRQGRQRLRVGLYKPWTASMDEGWTRWLFEEWGVPFDTVADARMRAGRLARDFDVIVIPDMSSREMVQGSPRAHPDYAGGLGERGTRALAQFVEQGGTLLLLDSSSEFAIQHLGVRVRDIEAAQQQSDPDRWYAPGSLLRVRWDTAHPLASGMPEESAVFYARSPVFEVLPEATNVTVIARYPESDLLLSGYSQGEDRIAGKAAMIEAQLGRGRVVMFGFRPQHRAQPHDTFRVLFNALHPR